MPMVAAGGSGLDLLWVGCLCFGEDTLQKREEKRKKEG